MATVKYHPDEWKDGKRMKYLMTDFRSRDANPEGYDDKMSFWKRSILKWSSSHPSVAEFSLKSVCDSFEKDGQAPSVGLLRTVLGVMVARNEVMKRDQYKEMLMKSCNEGWVSWGMGLAVRPISWGINTLIGSSSLAPTDQSSLHPDDILINPEVIDSLARELYSKYKDSPLLKYDTLEEKVKREEGMKGSLFELVLLKLQCEKRIAITEDCNMKLIKFGSRPVFTQSEIGLVRLESAKEVVESDIRIMESSLEGLKKEARDSLKEGNRVKAKQILRKKRRLEVQIRKRESQLDNIDFLLEQLVDCESHPTILTALKAAADILKAHESKYDEISSTLNEVEDVVSAHQEIASDLSRTFDKSMMSELELEEELNELLLEEEAIGGREERRGNEGKLKEKSSRNVIEPSKEGKQEIRTEPVHLDGREELEGKRKTNYDEDQELEDLMDRLERLRGNDFDTLPKEEEERNQGKKTREKVVS